MATRLATSISPILGITSTEVYALTLLSFHEGENTVEQPLYESLTRKGYIENRATAAGPLKLFLTEKARILLATFHH